MRRVTIFIRQVCKHSEGDFSYRIGAFCGKCGQLKLTVIMVEVFGNPMEKLSKVFLGGKKVQNHLYQYR